MKTSIFYPVDTGVMVRMQCLGTSEIHLNQFLNDLFRCEWTVSGRNFSLLLSTCSLLYGGTKT